MKYNAEQDLKYIEQNLCYFLNIVGLGASELDAVTIDDFVDAARALMPFRNGEVTITTVGPSLIKNTPIITDPVYIYLRVKNIPLVASIRRFWYLRQLAIGAINRG
jgi:hypothetical protein